tara:strand:- start:3065 stop:3340 length:276 start_codon:yes stop_codon:yes gene_type:complete
MGVCYFCESEARESYMGSWCSGCRQLKNLCNVYGYERILLILKEVCIRNEDQLEKKILAKKGLVVNPKITDEKNEYYLRRKNDKIKPSEEK